MGRDTKTVPVMDGYSLDDVVGEAAPQTPATARSGKDGNSATPAAPVIRSTSAPAVKGGISVDDVAPAYETALTPREEVKFTAWKAQHAPNDSGADYDLRGAFKANMRPDVATGHWPDTYKKPNHPTFSDQSQYAKDAPERAGKWDGETYVPPQPAGVSIDDVAPEGSPGFSGTAGGAATGVVRERKQPRQRSVMDNFDATAQADQRNTASPVAPVSGAKYKELQQTYLAEPETIQRMAKKQGVLGEVARKIISEGEPPSSQPTAAEITKSTEAPHFVDKNAPSHEPPPTSWGEVWKVFGENARLSSEAALANTDEAFARSGQFQREDTLATAQPSNAIRQSTLDRIERQAAADKERARAAALTSATLQKDIEAATPKNMTTAQQAVLSLAQSGLPTLVGIGLGIAGAPHAGALLAGVGGAAMQGSGTYREAFDAYKKDGLSDRVAHSKAARAAGIDALLEAGGEAAPFGILFGAWKGAAKMAGKAVLAEGASEGLTQLAQDFHAYHTYNQSLTPARAWENFKVAVLAGGFGGIVYSTPVAIAEKYANRDTVGRHLKDWAEGIGASSIDHDVINRDVVAAMNPDNAGMAVGSVREREQRKDHAALSRWLADERPGGEIIAEEKKADEAGQAYADRIQNDADAERQTAASAALESAGIPAAGTSAVITWPDGEQFTGTVLHGSTPEAVRVRRDDGEQFTINATTREADFAPVPVGEGTPSNPVVVEHESHIEHAAQRIDESRSWPQIKAGNDRKAHILWHDLPITIEVGKGDVRESSPDAPKQWSVEMPHAYGYVKGSKGADGDESDVAVVGMHPTAHVFDTVNTNTGEFDEHKTILGAGTTRAATYALRAMYDDGAAGRIGGVRAMTIPEYRAWLKTDASLQPVVMEAPQGVSIDDVADQQLQEVDHAAETGQQSANDLEQHSGVPSGQHIRADEGEVRRGESEQASGSRGLRERPPASDEPHGRDQVGEGESQAQPHAAPVPAEPVKKRPELSDYTIKQMRKAADRAIKKDADARAEKAEAARHKLTESEIRKAAGAMRLNDDDIEIVRLIDAARVRDPELLNNLSDEMLSAVGNFTGDDYVKVLKEIISGNYQAAPQKTESSGDETGTAVRPAKKRGRSAEPAAESTGVGVDDVAGTLDVGRLIDDQPQTPRRTKRAVNGLGEAKKSNIKYSLGEKSQTETPAFARFMGGSMVTKDGKPWAKPGDELVVYHGTAGDFTKFDTSLSGKNFGEQEPYIFLVSARDAANDYASNAARTTGGGANVMPVYVRLKNPLVINKDSDGRGEMSLIENRAGLLPEIREALDGDVYDGVIARDLGAINTRTGAALQIVIAKNSKQTKSAIGNDGTYGLDNPDILYSLGQPAHTPEFDAWFGDGKLKADGEPIAFYHGTDKEFEAFDKQAIGKKDKHITSGLGFFFSPSREFSKKYGDRVLSVYLNLKNPFVMPYLDTLNIETHADAVKLREQLQKQGYDGVVVPKNEIGFKGYAIAFESNSIKSTDNFRPTSDNRFRYSRGDEPMFYSALSRSIESMPLKSAPVDQWKSSIKNLTQKGVKTAEIEAVGINEWLDLQEGKVSKDAVLEFVRNNGVKVTDVELSGDAEMDISVTDATYDDPDDDFIDMEVDDFYLQQAIDDIAEDREIETDEVNKDEAREMARERALEAYYEEPQMSGSVTVEFLGKTFEYALNYQGGDELYIWRKDGTGDSIYNGKPIDEAQIKAKVRDDVMAITGREEGGQTHFEDYTLPGGEDYTELLMTMPASQFDPAEVKTLQDQLRAADNKIGNSKHGSDEWTAAESEAKELRSKLSKITGDAYGIPKKASGAAGRRDEFRSSHFSEPNILAHVRFKTRKDADGKKVLFVEEFQSDWAQKGKKEGFSQDTTGWRAEVLSKSDSGFTVWRVIDAESNYITKIVGGDKESAIRKAAEGIPTAPFVTKTEAWLGLLVKRVIRYAAENDFDRVAWTTGVQNAERYKLSRHIDTIGWSQGEHGKVVRMNHKSGNSGYTSMQVTPDGVIDGSSRYSNDIVDKKLSDVVGVDLAAKIMASEEGELDGVDMDVGGSGMRAFYDKIVPNVVNDVLKKLGGDRVIEVNFSESNAPRTDWRKSNDDLVGIQPGFDITPKLKEVALAGLPLFARGVKFTDRYKANQAEITKRIVEIVKQIAPTADVKVVEQIFAEGSAAMKSGAPTKDKVEAAGYYDPARDLITVALRYEDYQNTARHEPVHYLKRMGFFTDGEWSVLEQHSKKEWMGRYGVPDAEEGIAYAFGAYRRGEQFGGRVARIFAKIREFLQRLANMLHGVGFQTWQDVFEKIESGKVGSRQQGQTSLEPAMASVGKRSQGEERADKLTAMKPTPAPAFADRDAARDAYKDSRQNMVVTADGDRVKLTGRAAHKIGSHAASASTRAAFGNASTLLPNAIRLWSQPERSPAVRSDTIAFHHYGLRATIEGEPHYVRYVVREVKAGLMLYDADAAPENENPRSSVGAVRLPKPVPQNREGGHSIHNWLADVKAGKYSTGEPVQTDTPAFKKWFGDSKVIDADGKPLVVYHGSGQVFTEFKNRGGKISTVFGSEDVERSGFFFAVDKDYASLFAEGATPNVLEVYLAIKNPIDLRNGILNDDAEALAAQGINDRWLYQLTRDPREAWELFDGDDGADLVKALRAAGYDGARIVEPRHPSTNAVIDAWVAFSPTQIKSATNNDGTYGLDNPDIRYAVNPDKDLIIQHNVTAANVMHADRMGGIPVPSLAITKGDDAMTNFGEITLLGDRALADPHGYAHTQVFGADIYSPRYPSIHYSFTQKNVDAMKQLLAPAIAATRNLEWDEVQKRGAQQFENEPAVMWQFLKDRGIEPDVVMKKRPTKKQVAELKRAGFEKYFGQKNWQSLARDEEFQRLSVNDTIRQYTESDLDLDYPKSFENAIESQRINGSLSYARLMGEIGKPAEVDNSATRDTLRAQVRKFPGDMEVYAQDLFDKLGAEEKLFKGYNYAGTRTYKPHTLDNVVRELKKEIRGGEGFNYGLGSARSKVTPRFTSIKQIKAESGRLVPKEKIEELKKEWDAQLHEIWEELAHYHDSGKDFGFGDTVIDTLAESDSRGLDRALKENQFDVERIPDDLKAKMRDFVDEMREWPTEYFEAKILRAVDLSEFKAAVVPKGTHQRVIDMLESKGLHVATYNPKANNGDSSDRKRVINSVSSKLDIKFSLGEKEADEANQQLTAPPTKLTEQSPFGSGTLADDVNWLTKFAVHPRTIATTNKDFAPVYLAAVHQFERRDEIASNLQRDAQPYFDLPATSKQRVNAALELGRLNGVVYGTGSSDVVVTNDTGRPDALLAPGDTMTLTDREKAGYWAIRRSMDKALTLFKEQVIREWGLDPAKVSNARQIMDSVPAGATSREVARYQQAAMLVREIDEARKKGYVPFNRWGQVGIIVKDPDIIDSLEDGKQSTQHFEMVEVDSLLQKAKRAVGLTSKQLSAMPEVAARLDALKKEYPDAHIAVFQTKPNQPLAGDVKMTDLDMLAAVSQIDESAWQSVREGLSDAIQARGFRKHFFGSKNIPGYSQDFERSIADYIVGISGYLARRETNPMWDESIKSIPTEKPLLTKYAQSYRDYVNSPTEEFAGLRQAAFFYYLAGVPSTALINTTQVGMLTAPYLTQFANPAVITKELAEAYKDAATMLRFGSDVFNPAHAPDDIRDDFQQAWDEGFFVPVTTYEMMGLAHNRMPALRHMAKRARQTLDTVSYLFNAAERTNRVVTFIASVRLAKRAGFSDKVARVLGKNELAGADLLKNFTPSKFAEFVIDETHFRMGKVNRPQAMRGAGAALLQFKGFTFQSVELYYRLAAQNGRQGKIAFALMMLLLMGTSGLWGLPFGKNLVDFIEFLYKKYTDTDADIKTAVREVIYDITSSAQVARALTDGALSQTVGVDVGARIGQGAVLPESTSDLGGVPLSLTAGKLGQSLEYAQRGQGMLALAEIMPNFIKNPMTAYTWGEEGVKSQKTGKVFMAPESVTTADKAKKSIGFTPEGLSNIREGEYAVKRAEHAVDQLRGDYYARLATIYAKAQRAEDNGRTKEAISLEIEGDKIYDEIAKFNEGRADHEQVNIENKTLQARVREELFGFEQRRGKERKAARDRADKIRQVYGTGVAGD